MKFLSRYKIDVEKCFAYPFRVYSRVNLFEWKYKSAFTTEFEALENIEAWIEDEDSYTRDLKEYRKINKFPKYFK